LFRAGFGVIATADVMEEPVRRGYRLVVLGIRRDAGTHSFNKLLSYFVQTTAPSDNIGADAGRYLPGFCRFPAERAIALNLQISICGSVRVTSVAKLEPTKLERPKLNQTETRPNQEP
jgi:hypothetical protein